MVYSYLVLPLGLLLLLFFVAALSLALGKLVFGPLEKAAPIPPRRWHYGTVDVLVLITQLQMAAALVLFVAPVTDLVVRMELTFFAFGLIGTWWCQGLRLLAQVERVRIGDRLWFLSLMLPVGYTISLLTSLVPLVLLVAIALMTFASDVPDRHPVALGLLALTMCHFAVIFGCRLLCSTLVSPAGRGEDGR